MPRNSIPGIILVLAIFACGRFAAGGDFDAGALAPTADKPVKVAANDANSRDGWDRAIKDYTSLPAEQVTAHPAADDFPGAVPAGAQSETRSFDFPLNLPRWQSTGLYAAPGARITVAVSGQAPKGLAVVIGAQTDSIEKLDKWTRFPKIGRRFEIEGRQTLAANAFGGLVYIDVPRDPALGGYHFATFGGYGWLDEHPERVAGSVHVTISGAVAAPLYRAGKTTPREWQRERTAAAPWGELAGQRIIFTLPSSVLRELDDPAPVLAWWDSVVDAEASLAGWGRQPAPPERVVVDREISAGFMHSGYPIMCHLGSGPGFLKLENLRTKGEWGLFHELGHNHQGQCYTFSGYTETTVNLFSMYVMATIVHRDMKAHPALSHIDRLLHDRLSTPPKTGPWEDLSMYVLPIEGLDWGPLQRTLASYAAPNGAAGLKNDEQKMDEFVLRYSQAAHKNLAPYLAQFGVKCSQGTLSQVRQFPQWMPSGFPEKYTAAAPGKGGPGGELLR